jgi:two-component system response regulator ChvI
MLEAEKGAVCHDGTCPEGEPIADACNAVPGSPRLILVDKDRYYREALAIELADEGFAVQSFGDTQSMSTAVASGLRADVVILDWESNEPGDLPDLAARLSMPVVILSNRNYPVLERLALERGAADFIGKALASAVLAARLRRVADQGRTVPNLASSEETVRCGRLTLRRRTSRACWDDSDIGLTMAEFRVVSLLVSNVGTFVTYRQIYDSMRYKGFAAGGGEEGYRINVRSAIRRIRNKFKAVSSDFNEIRTFTSFGYSWGQAPTVLI